MTLLTKVHIVKAMVFPVVMYGCESWTIKKAERQSNVYGHVRMEPGMAYEMPKNDPEFRKSILAATQNTEMTNQELLDQNGIEYEVMRPSCHCRKPYLKFKCVEVFEGESD